MKLNVIASRSFWLMLGWLVVAIPANAFYDPSLGRWFGCRRCHQSLVQIFKSVTLRDGMQPFVNGEA